MNILSGISRAIVHDRVALALGPAASVSMTPALICGAVTFIILLILCFVVLKIQDAKPMAVNGVEPSQADIDKEKPKNIAMGVLFPVMFGFAAGAILYNIMFSYTNPAHAAASQGLRSLYNY